MSLSEDPITPDDEEEAEGPPYFADSDHALHTGYLVGTMLKAGFTVVLGVDAEGNYTDIVEIALPPLEDGLEPIRVTVSAGVLVPDVRGKSLQNAQAQLSELGWRVARADRGQYPGYPAGTVVLQHPPPGQVASEPGELALGVAQ